MQAFRIDRLCAAAGAQGVDCLVASSAENIAYMSGGYTSIGQSVSASTQIYTVLSVASRSISYVVSVADVPNILEFAGLSACIYCYGPFHFEFASEDEPFTRTAEAVCARRFATAEEALAAAVKSAGSAPAFDETHIHFQLAKKLAQVLGIDELAPASPIFREARRVKHPQEIRMLRESAQIAEEALLQALHGAKPGITEAELETRYRMAVIRRGAIPYFFVATAAKRAAFVDAHNTDLQIGAGDMIRFDFGCVWHGFYSDLARTAVLGAPDEETLAAYNAVAAGAQAQFAKLRPGVTAQEMFRVAVEETRKAGISDYRRSHCGHGIGMEGYDVPSLAEGVDTVIEKNMVLCLETPYYRVGWGGVQIEHTVAVTDDGFEFLDSGDNSLIIVPID